LAGDLRAVALSAAAFEDRRVDDSEAAALVQRFAQNLKQAREALPGKVSQEALADLCDIHRTEVSRLETGQREPRLTTIVKLARGMQLDPRDLLRGMDR
jgi:transcriptional regulator with XRE-family HTH domain